MENLYDNADFFTAHARMPRSREGLSAAGEWHQLEPLIPPLEGRNVLDLGCGYGWHCKYAAEHGAASVLGIDQSQRMIREATTRNAHPRITYRVCDLQDFDYPANAFDLVISNLVFHYVPDLEPVFEKIHRTLKPGGVFLFNIEHPVFTAGIRQEWLLDGNGSPAAWPVDNYFYPGPRETVFLGRPVLKYHHTLTQILMGLRRVGFTLDHVEEAQPSMEMLTLPGMADEMRRPMMLLVRAIKNIFLATKKTVWDGFPRRFSHFLRHFVLSFSLTRLHRRQPVTVIERGGSPFAVSKAERGAVQRLPNSNLKGDFYDGEFKRGVHLRPGAGADFGQFGGPDFSKRAADQRAEPRQIRQNRGRLRAPAGAHPRHGGRAPHLRAPRALQIHRLHLPGGGSRWSFTACPSSPAPPASQTTSKSIPSSVTASA